MDAIRDEDYIDFGIAFQSVMVEHLNGILTEKGVEDEDSRREICETFLSGLGDFFDQHWLDCDGRRVHPVLAFAENHLDLETPLQELGHVMFPATQFAHREYVIGTLADFYEENQETIPGITTGPVGEEEDEFYDDGVPDEW